MSLVTICSDENSHQQGWSCFSKDFLIADDCSDTVLGSDDLGINIYKVYAGDVMDRWSGL